MSAPATWYVGWSTTTPNQDGSNFTEPTVGGYARVAITNGTAEWTMTDNVPSGTTVWAASTAYAVNATTRPTLNSDTGYYYVCTTAGTSSTVAPTWPTVVGSTVTDGTVVWTTHAAEGKAAVNAAAISFPQSTAAQGTPTYLGIFDAATAGDLWEYAPISGASAIGASTTLTIPANDLTLYND